ncbi:MAG TPA: carbon storage regulator CsrA [Solirubrobacteraceae bacterium]|nr:carbon storage regulator CsrA [Solirubrobacteraceae bacterium]
MLNITRRRGERIVLGDDVFISVLEVSGQTVRLGIEAPRSVRVYREEIWLEVKAANEAAAHASGSAFDDMPAPLKSDTGSAGTAVNRAGSPE